MQRPTSKAKGLIGKPHQIGTPGGIQSESPSRIRVSGNFRAFSDAKIDSEIDQKSTPQASRGTQNRPKIAPGTPLGRFGAPRSVREAPRERLGGVPGAPRERPESPPGRPGTPERAPGMPGSAPRLSKSTPSRVRERQSRVSGMRLARDALSERLFADC